MIFAAEAVLLFWLQSPLVVSQDFGKDWILTVWLSFDQGYFVEATGDQGASIFSSSLTVGYRKNGFQWHRYLSVPVWPEK